MSPTSRSPSAQCGTNTGPAHPNGLPGRGLPAQRVQRVQAAGGAQPLRQRGGVGDHRGRGEPAQHVRGRCVSAEQLIQVVADDPGPVDVLRGRPPAIDPARPRSAPPAPTVPAGRARR
ncbi:hypothetical protein ACFPM0_36000, partial [Pseudonocardia sulfidoxydans]|uniref:hypothetical protein n=1 Tax=Pseudonocardia sulfidoxydans TaxID=54011 RepID=UPI003605BA00